MKPFILNKEYCSPENIREASRIFNAKSVLNITKFITDDIILLIRDEVDHLISKYSLRRDLQIATTW